MNESRPPFIVGDTLYVPVPQDAADAHKLYEEDPFFYEAINQVDESGRNVTALLRSGPNCFEVDARRLGLAE